MKPTSHKTTPIGFSYLCIFQPAPCIWLRLCLHEHRSTYLPNTERAQLSYLIGRLELPGTNRRLFAESRTTSMVYWCWLWIAYITGQAIVNAIGLVIRALDTCSFWLTPRCLAHIVKSVMSSQLSHHENIVISRSVELSMNFQPVGRSIDRSIAGIVPGVRTVIVVPRQPNRPIYSLYK